MTRLRRRAAAWRRISRRSNASSTSLSSEPVILRDGQAAVDRGLCCWSTICSSTSSSSRSSRGDPRTALAQAEHAGATQSEARRVFGTDNVDRPDADHDLARHVTATIASPASSATCRSNSAIVRFTIVARFDSQPLLADTPTVPDLLGLPVGLGLFHAAARAPIRRRSRRQLPAWERRNIPDETDGQPATNAGDDQDWQLVNVRDIHLGEAQDGAMTPGNDRRTIVTFAIIALLILGMACVNFTNLATARASQRAREVALRKVLGANRKQLIVQFLGESVLIAAIAMLLALALVELLLPAFDAFLDADMSMHLFRLRAACCCRSSALVLLVGAAGGIYPAFYLSRFQPAQVLKANKSVGRGGGLGPAAQRPRRRPVRGVDRPDHLHRGDLCPDRLRAHRRSRLPARRPDPDRQIWPRASCERRSTPLRRGDRADAGRHRGRPHRRSASPPTTTTRSPASRLPGSTEPVSTGHLRRSIPASSRRWGCACSPGAVRRSTGRRRRHRAARRSSRSAERALAARGVNVVINEPPRARLGFAIAAGRRSARRSASAYRRPEDGAGAGHDHRRRQRRALPLDPRADRSDHVLSTSATASRNARRPLSTARSARRARAGVERSGSGSRPTCRSTASFGDDSVRELYDARRGARADLRRLRPARGDRSPASACSASPPSPPSGGPRRSASARCSAPAPATSSGCSPGNSPSRC